MKNRTEAARCAALAGAREMMVRAGSGARGLGADSSFVEVDSAVELSSGFAVGVLESGLTTRALVAWFDGRGQERVVDLGRVHGSVEPPRLLAVGDDLVVALSDNDASHATVRLARVQKIDSKAQVTWGPTVLRPKSESLSIELALSQKTGKGQAPTTVFLAWDTLDRASLRSRIHWLGFSVESMKVTARQRRLSPIGDDAALPRLLVNQQGLWLFWLAYGNLEEEKGTLQSSMNLVEEAPRVLRVQRMSPEGEIQGDALNLSPSGVHVFSYDVSFLDGESLLVTYRAAQSGRPVGATPIHIRILGGDGSIEKDVLTHPELGPGAPLLLEGKGAPWLLVGGNEDQVLLGSFQEQGRIFSFRPETGLRGQIPLLRQSDQILGMRPIGMDLALSLSECSELKNAPE